ncbi:MAG: hypothetical protein MJ212_01670 [Alphaproteobacteria bacterium]|nr:hypothetical protein [Alphaproteobacteria bacterium]
MTENLKFLWKNFYADVPGQLEKIGNVKSVATAFNTNIDAVLKVSGQRIRELAQQVGLTQEDLADTKTNILTPKDVVRGIIKCFKKGIAEEWVCENSETYQWMRQNLGYDRLQMGGQGGIIANLMAVIGVQKVLVHTNSHPALQAAQFLAADNLFGFDENGVLKKAANINRPAEDAMIHWILEFDGGDAFEIFGETIHCPKSNRFIATYDPANSTFKTDDTFIKYLTEKGYDYLFLSGYSNLLMVRGGVGKIMQSAEQIKEWRLANPKGVIHLELASTQDIDVRRAIIEYIAPLADSVGMNERETLDSLHIVDADMYNRVCNQELTAPLLFEIIVKLKRIIKIPRLQLHMFGLYVTVQDKCFKVSPKAGKKGMMLAATLAASKCAKGNLDTSDNILWSHGLEVADKSLEALHQLAVYLNNDTLLLSGIAEYAGYDVIAVPTILIDKPLTLVGMGDTISSVSLVGAQD